MRCQHCGGTGDFFDWAANDWISGRKCETCDGWGEVPEVAPTLPADTGRAHHPIGSTHTRESETSK